MPAQATSTDTGDRRGSVVFGPVTDVQTYKNLLYLFLRFPLGIAYFTVFLTGIVLGITLSVLLVGLVVLAVVLAGARYLGAVESYLAGGLLGTDVAYDLPDPSDQSLTAFLGDIVTDPRTYVLLAFGFATFPIGVGVFTVLVTLFALSVALTVAPFVYWLPWTQYRVATLDPLGGPLVVDTLPEALVAGVAGIALFVVTLHLVNLGARAHGAFVGAVVDQKR